MGVLGEKGLGHPVSRMDKHTDQACKRQAGGGWRDRLGLWTCTSSSWNPPAYRHNSTRQLCLRASWMLCQRPTLCQEPAPAGGEPQVLSSL